MVNPVEHRLLALILTLGGLYLLMAYTWGIPLTLNVDVSGQQVLEMTVAVTGARPAITNIKCCFKDSDTSAWGNCGTGPYSITGGEPYDIMCNFTVSDSNGYQDMADGWVNITWYNVAAGGGWGHGLDNDNQYRNVSCLNKTAPAPSGNSIWYECAVYRIKHWADAGTWRVLVNSSDHAGAGPNGIANTQTIVISNVTSIWQSASVSFGTMSLGQNGSDSGNNIIGTNKTDVDAITNNTGNCRLKIELYSQGGAPNMVCSIGTIPVARIKYDTTDNTNINAACGALATSQEWDADCAGEVFNVQDCSDTCSSLPLDYTYWGICIPTSAVGGTCALNVLPIGVAAP